MGSGEISSFIGDIPHHYDACLGPILFADYAVDIAQRVAADRPARVLELAAGTGIVTRQLRDALAPEARLTATDLNPPMLEIAQGKFGGDGTVEFQAADAMALPFGDATFDAVVCQFGVMFFPDKDKSYREVHRVLVPGGRYLFNVWDSHLENAFGRIAYDVSARFFPDDPPRFQKAPFAYSLADPIRASLVAAGFVAIEATVVRIDKPCPDVVALARGFVYGSPLIYEIREREGADPDTVMDAMARAFEKEFGEGAAPMALQAIVWSATKPS